MISHTFYSPVSIRSQLIHAGPCTGDLGGTEGGGGGGGGGRGGVVKN